jgi:hypothetical protein
MKENKSGLVTKIIIGLGLVAAGAGWIGGGLGEKGLDFNDVFNYVTELNPKTDYSDECR